MHNWASRNLNILSVSSQHEKITELNPDRVFWLYQTLRDSNNKLELRQLENIFVSFRNQYEEGNIKWLDDSDTCILDLKEFSQWRISVLHWEIPSNFSIDEISMASWWVIEFFEAEKKWEIDWRVKNSLHMITTLRDGGSTSENQRTTTAGRIVWDDIDAAIEQEHVEEAPFLWTLNWEYYLCISSVNTDDLFSSILNFMSNKYSNQDKRTKQYKERKNMFERSFPWIKYEELGEILTWIIRNKRVIYYDYEELDEIQGLEWMKKEVKIGDKTGTFYGFYNPKLKTWEFKSMRKFCKFPKWFNCVSKFWRPSRLFLESFNQSPRFSRIENVAWSNPANAIKIISEEMRDNISGVVNSVHS